MTEDQMGDIQQKMAQGWKLEVMPAEIPQELQKVIDMYRQFAESIIEKKRKEMESPFVELRPWQINELQQCAQEHQQMMTKAIAPLLAAYPMMPRMMLVAPQD